MIKVHIWHDEGIYPEIDMQILQEVNLPAVPKVGDSINTVGDILPVRKVIWNIDENSGEFTHVDIHID